MTLQENVILIERIEKKGLKELYKSHVAYLYKNVRKGFISKEEYLKNLDSILTTLGN
jgi:hypothetical protein